MTKGLEEQAYKDQLLQHMISQMYVSTEDYLSLTLPSSTTNIEIGCTIILSVIPVCDSKHTPK